ncbi:MAG: hypothetical protein QXU32_11065 [Nitrososphaerales archaeon]
MGKHRHCKHYFNVLEENRKLKHIIRKKDEELEEKDRKIALLEKKVQYYENSNSLHQQTHSYGRN